MGDNWERERFNNYWNRRLEEELEEREQEIRDQELAAVDAFQRGDEDFFLGEIGHINRVLSEGNLTVPLTDEEDYSGCLLHYAVHYSMPKVIRYLLHILLNTQIGKIYYPNTNINGIKTAILMDKDSDDHLPIFYAIRNNNVPIARQLVEAGYKVQTRDILQAVEEDKKKVLRYLLSAMKSDTSYEMRRFICDLEKTLPETKETKVNIKENCERRVFKDREPLAAIYHTKMKKYNNKQTARKLRELLGNEKQIKYESRSFFLGGKKRRNKTRRVSKERKAN